MITIKELLEACKEQVAKGNGDKGILLARDDEGNGFYSCGYLFTEDIWEFTDPDEMHMTVEDFENCIILG